VLAIGDDELSVGDDEDASSEAAEGLAHVVDWEITWLVLDLSMESRLAGPGLPRVPSACWERECQECLYLYLLSSYLCSPQKNKSNDISYAT